MKGRLLYLYYLIFAGSVLLFFNTCFKEKFVTDASSNIKFSTDTLTFDTVFTTVGSATRSFRIVNPYDLPIIVSKIELEAGGQSKFRFNVDGVTYKNGVAEDIEIWANDSIWVFVEVTVDPDQPLSQSPYVINERIHLITNGQSQHLILEAWGQNANYIPNNRFNGKIAILSCDLNEVVWDDPKPYVIYGLLLVDSCTLRIPEGTQIYVHGGIAKNEFGIYDDGILWILQNGKLIIDGTLENPVVIQGDRLEEEFLDQEGQWGGIRIGAASKGNQINHTTIRNSIVGVRVDSAASLDLKNSQIYNTASSGIIGIHAKMNVQNSLLHSNNGIGVILRYGGDYEFDYVTVANYGNGNESLYMDNFICRDPECSSGDLYRLNANMRNCIFTGSDADEISLIDASSSTDLFSFEVSFRNCLVRVDELLDENQYPKFFEICRDCVENKNFDDLLFESIDENDYHLDSLSIAENGALPLSNIKVDIEGKERDPASPDIGCYEY